MSTTLQQTMDQYQAAFDGEHRQIDVSSEQVEECIELFSEYLQHFSDLFQESEEYEEGSMDEWEAALESYVEHLFDGDTEHVPDLGSMPLDVLDAEHLRDFLGWFLLRIPGMDSLEVEAFGSILRDWNDYVFEKKYIDAEQHADFLEVLDEMQSEAVRVTKAAHLLLHYVRMGGGVSPRLRGKTFSNFIEGHARIVRLEKMQDCCVLWLEFDNNFEGKTTADSPTIGPIRLHRNMKDYLLAGDVLDIELGFRGDQWIIVDIGPVYPASIYMETDLFDPPQKIT